MKCALIGLLFLVPGIASATNSVTICHNNQTISVSSNALFGHLLHGDKLGACVPVVTPPATTTPTTTPPVVSTTTPPVATTTDPVATSTDPVATSTPEVVKKTEVRQPMNGSARCDRVGKPSCKDFFAGLGINYGTTTPVTEDVRPKLVELMKELVRLLRLKLSMTPSDYFKG